MVKDKKKINPRRQSRPFQKSPSGLTCWCCKEKGHTACTCKKLSSTLSKFHEIAIPQVIEEQEQVMMAKGSIYLDSMATSHMTNQLDWLDDYEELRGKTVKVGNGIELTIKGKGSLPLSIETESGTVSYEVIDILYMPELCETLLSIGEIAKEGHQVIFDRNAVWIQLNRGDSFEVERL